ncbi:unnamed protein product [Lota lota]
MTKWFIPRKGGVDRAQRVISSLVESRMQGHIWDTLGSPPRSNMFTRVKIQAQRDCAQAGWGADQLSEFCLQGCRASGGGEGMRTPHHPCPGGAGPRLVFSPLKGSD